MTHIAILGAGAGGAMTANLLHRKLNRDVSITLVDKSTDHFYQPSFYLVPFGYLEPEQSRDIRGLVHDDVEFVHDAVTGVNPDEEQVHLADADEDLDYDYLVVATGHRLAPETTPGMVEGWEDTDAVYPFYHYEAALAMREGLQDFDGGTFLVTQPDTPIKCPGAPLKMTMLAEDYARRQGFRDDAEFIMTRNAEHHFGVQPYRDKLYEIWDERDIEFRAHTSVEEVDPDAQVVHTNDGQIEYDFYAPVSPQYGQEAITENSPLTEGDDENEGEYVTIDQHTLRHDVYDNVFALGDCENAPHSKTAAAARKEAHVVAENLADVIDGREPSAEYDGYAACPLLTKKGKAMMAEFDYEDSISAPIESRTNWIMDVNVLPSIYWNFWMRGYDPLPM